MDLSFCYCFKVVIIEKFVDGSMYFTIMKYLKEVLEVMSILWRFTKLCDVIFLVGEEKFLVYKIVLVAVSLYFRVMFIGGMREEEMIIIFLYGITSCTLVILIEFAYTAEVCVSEMNVCYFLLVVIMF